MNKVLIKLGTGLATATLLVGSMASSAFAATITVSGNGNGSTNGVVVTDVCANTLVQKNTTNVVTVASVSANTGGNSANKNTLGADSEGVSIETGAASAGMMTTVEGGQNMAEAQPNACCECQGDTDIDISTNGNNSHNGVVLTKSSGGSTKQKNKTNVVTTASVKAKTGKNTAKKNTLGAGSGAVNIVTGPATAVLEVSVTSSGNSL